MDGEQRQQPRLSVVVCTIGRQDVARAVESIVESGRAAGAELDVVVAWQGREKPPAIGGARMLDVFPVGLSYARNRGLDASAAPLVAFLDDDEVADAGWAGAVLQSFEELGAAAGAFGPVAPLDDLARAYCRYEGEERRVFTGARTGPWFVGTGGNMAFRREALAEAGGFDLRFGAGAVAHAAEDWDVIVRFLRAGRTLVWSPEMVVYHPTKSDAAHLASRFPYGYGVGHLMRTHRDPVLALRYSKAIAQALWGAARRRDRARLRETGATLRGFVAGTAARGRPLSPSSALERVPGELESDWRPLEMVFDGEPLLRYRDGAGRILRVYVHPSERLTEDVSARDHAVPGRDALWVVSPA